MRKKTYLKIILSLLLLCLLLFGSYQLMNARSYQIFGNITNSIETDEKVVALTFDDGPTQNVDQILPLLQQYDAKATFFLIGQDIEKFPEETKAIIEAGHQVGNHTFSHARMIFKSPTFIEEEIDKTDELIREAGYKGEIDFRPPNGKKLVFLPYFLKQQEKETITWNIEPDTFFTTPEEKIDYVLEEIQPGSIILLHPMYDQSGDELQVIEEILRALTKEGYRFVTVDELQA
ncbi:MULTISPECIES: polysaccharide deacetylase family protein [Cytobacillus]|uniref:Polysaccharide deacetylase family protein n=1 Tax=Cytobacillus stercorigallinarum TaxID=2762240 RepID=A0ABR8QTU7_9BACI|nr:polysaccharide deacetylase family protein [Cytobacillus stercorigallinarum]MBD7938956.1 polysaccharide deacetylase family protein [Cytobacillus stercorigallinarum]